MPEGHSGSVGALSVPNLSTIPKVFHAIRDALKAFVEERDYHAARRIHEEILLAYDKDFVKHADETLLGRLRLLWKNIPAQLAKENKKFVYKVLKEGARGHTQQF